MSFHYQLLMDIKREYITIKRNKRVKQEHLYQNTK